VGASVLLSALHGTGESPSLNNSSTKGKLAERFSDERGGEGGVLVPNFGGGFQAGNNLVNNFFNMRRDCGNL
jgi:hypothetical protein